jgi:hypothetical protein
MLIEVSANPLGFNRPSGDGEMAEAEAPAIPKQELLYCERFVELLTDMLSQVRR